MGIRIGRWTPLAVLGAGLATATALALTTAGTALADATDGTGTAVITFNARTITHLAKWGIVIVPESPAWNSDNAGFDGYNTTVTGGDGSDTNFSGMVDLGGALTFIDGLTGKTVQFTSLELNYFNGTITGIPAGTTKAVAILDFGGNTSVNNGTGTESFAASTLTVDSHGATYLNKNLGSSYVGAHSHKTYGAFTSGATICGQNAFSISYAVTIT
jgi:hypothetical protein